MDQYTNILSPLEYGGIRLKNRIIFAPTTMGLRGDEYFQKMEEIASGGCAMIIIGDVPVSKSRLPFSLFSKKGFEHYRKLSDIAHRNQCLLCAQLHQNDSNFKGMFKYIPGMISGKIDKKDLRSLVNKETGNYISAIPAEKVKEITESFGDAAVKAVEAGFDMIQIHGDRMCGSFSSTIFNHRTDEYGGSLENRIRFGAEAVASVRKKLPWIPIDYKLAVRQENPHYGNAGVEESEVPFFVHELEKAGVTSFHVTLADHGKLEDTIPPADHPEFGHQGCFLKFCDLVKKYTNLPVCGVGALSEPDYIEKQIREKRIDCAAMSRQLIADPQWVNKLINGQADEIRHCVRCNKKCLGGMYEHKGVHCIYDGNVVI